MNRHKLHTSIQNLEKRVEKGERKSFSGSENCEKRVKGEKDTIASTLAGCLLVKRFKELLKKTFRLKEKLSGSKLAFLQTG